MKSWYLTREAFRLTHRGQAIPEGKKILLTEAQAKLHNGKAEKVAKCNAPTDAKEVGVLVEWSDYQSTLKPTNKAKDRKAEGSKEVSK